MFSCILNAANKESKKADKYFAIGDYLNAIDMYKAALDKENDPSEKALYQYQIGIAYFRLNEIVNAEKSLNNAIKQGYMSAEAYLILGDVQLKQGKLDEAQSSYESYSLANPGDNSVAAKIASVKFSKENQNNLSLFKIEALSNRINSTRNEFGVNYFNESLIFSSTRNISSTDGEEEDKETDNKYSDRTIPEKQQKKNYTKEGLAQTAVWMAIGSGGNYNKAKELQELNKMKDFSDDGIMVYSSYMQQAYYTRMEGKKAYIYSMRIVGNKWQKNEQIEVRSQGEPIGHPFVSPKGDRIYFTSTMPGGKGKSDIWYISKIENTWNSEPVNAGDNINTSGNEVYPHISDGYFFFASDGRIGMGGLDIFVSKITSFGFEEPINLGAPFNSNGDDYNLIIRPDKSAGMLVSSRNFKRGSDIYRFDGFPSNQTIVGTIKDSNKGTSISNVSLELFVENKLFNKAISNANGDYTIPVRPNTTYRLRTSVPGYAAAEKIFTTPSDLFIRINKASNIDLDFNIQANASVISGKIYDIQTLTPLEDITVFLIANGVVQQTTNIDPSGIYKFSNLASNTEYTVRVDPKGYFWNNKKVYITDSNQRFEYNTKSGHDLDFAMQKFDIGKEIIIPDISFQEDKPNLLMDSYKELDYLAGMFIQNPHCIIHLKGHVDVVYKSEIAKNLSQYRVNAVKDYLLSKKVNPAQLTSPQGMGYQNPLVRNPVSKDEHQMNDRITYTVTKIDPYKELEYSRLDIGDQTTQSVAQTNTPPTQQPTIMPSQTQQVPQQSLKSYTALQEGEWIVQIASSKAFDFNQPNFMQVTVQLGLEIKCELFDGKYKYFVGFFSTKTEADYALNDIKKIGIKDAWTRQKY
jgi:outer membrane protein OmpA-like peptidoglycan-associated protein/tetratricopeptide (TPR) repeat protein